MALKHVILVLLREEKRTGYEIAKSFDDVLSFFWHASHQQIYRELKKLDQASLVSYKEIAQADKPNKKVYEITQEGKHTLLDWLTNLPTSSRVNNDELLVKLYAGEVIGKEKLLDILQAERGRENQKLEEFRQIEKTFFNEEVNMSVKDELVYCSLRRGLMATKTRINWVDECTERIQKMDF